MAFYLFLSALFALAALVCGSGSGNYEKEGNGPASIAVFVIGLFLAGFSITFAALFGASL
jgi:hypothetical protein